MEPRLPLLTSIACVCALSSTPVQPADAISSVAPAATVFHLDAWHPSVTLTFELVQDQIWLRAMVGPRQLWFVLDSGSSRMLLDKAVAKALGLRTLPAPPIHGGGSGAVALDAVEGPLTLQLTGLGTPAYPFYVTDLSGVSGALGRKLDGIIGYDFLRDFVVTVDYAQQRLVIADPGTFKAPADSSIQAIRFQGGWPLLRARLAVPGNPPAEDEFLVDSGSNDAVDHPLIKRSKGKLSEIRSDDSSLGGRVTGYVGVSDWLEIGSYKVPHPETFCCGGVEKIIGGEVLKHFVVTFDYSRSRIIFQRYRTSPL